MEAFFRDEGGGGVGIDRAANCRLDSAIDYFDVYGFAVFVDDGTSTFRDDRCHEFNTCGQECFSAGLDKEWTKVLKKWTHYKNGLGVKLLSVVKKGVPDGVRPSLWKKLLDIDLLKSSTQFCYQEQVAKLREYLTKLNVTEYNTDRAEQELCHVETYELRNDGLDNIRGEPSVQNLRQILLDVARTFPTHLLFLGDSAEAIEGRASLFRILAVYARFNPSVGYCQGMSFIAGMLAMVLSEEDSFWCMVALLQKPKYLQGYFDVSLSRVQMHAKIFDRLLKQRQSQLWEHLRAHNVDPLMYITPWLMCLFTSLPCWDVVLSVWDIIFLEGFTVIFRVALAIMELLKDDFLSETDGNQLIMLLQSPPPTTVNRNLLLPAVWNTNVDLWELQTIQAIIDEENKAERDSSMKAPICDPPSKSKGAVWKRVQKKIKNEEPSLLSKIAQMFNVKSQKNSEVTALIPAGTILNVSDRPCLTDINGRLIGHASPASSPAAISTISNSTSENLSRIQRIVSGKRTQSQSVESLGKGLDYVANSDASQMQAFGVFSHQLPLRQNQLSRTSLIGIGLSPEMELQSIMTSTLKDDRIDDVIANRGRRCHKSSPPDDEWASPQATPRFRKHVKKRQSQQEQQREEDRKRLRHNNVHDVSSSGGASGDLYG